MFERKLISGCPAIRGIREFGPKGVIVMTSGSPTTREDIFKFLNLPTQTGPIHALVDAGGITETWPLSWAAIGDIPSDDDAYLKILVCEPIGLNPKLRHGMAVETLKNLATCIVHLCRHHKMDPDKAVIRFVGRANENGLTLPERGHPVSRKKSANSLPFFERSQSAASLDGSYAEDLIKAEVTALRVEIARLHEEITTMPAELPVDAIGVGDVVLFQGGSFYKSRGASAAETSTAVPQLGVVRRVYPQSKHGYEVALSSGTWFVNKSTLRKSPLGRVGN